jgi:hypothetical protein
MKHLEWHQHAFLDKENKVFLVAVFEEWAHNHQLLEDVRIANNAEKIICCCEYGLANVGDTWTGIKFQSKQPFLSWGWNDILNIWEAPTPMPEDGIYYWDEATISWVILSPE